MSLSGGRRVALKIVFEPSLAADLVQLASRDNPERLVEYRALWDGVYEQPLEKRQEGFYSIHRELIGRWGVDGALIQALDELPALNSEISEILIARARSPKDEGADLSWDNQRIGIKLQVERFLDSRSMLHCLRHELMHIGDMLDAAFGYCLEPLDLTPHQEILVRERYGLLWDICIESRLEKASKETTASQQAWQSRFFALFATLPEAQRSPAFHGIWDSPGLTHQEIMEKALEPAKFMDEAGRPSPRTPGAKCPLCHFPTYQWMDVPSGALALVQVDFPQWQPGEGMCPRCNEYYALKVGVW